MTKSAIYAAVLAPPLILKLDSNTG